MAIQTIDIAEVVKNIDFTNVIPLATSEKDGLLSSKLASVLNVSLSNGNTRKRSVFHIQREVLIFNKCLMIAVGRDASYSMFYYMMAFNQMNQTLFVKNNGPNIAGLYYDKSTAQYYIEINGNYSGMDVTLITSEPMKIVRLDDNFDLSGFTKINT